jgi:hypothetical protein
MQTRIYCALMAVVSLIGLAVHAQAQARERVKVQMAQEFVVRGVVMPAGEYDIRQVETGFAQPMLLIAGPNGHSVLAPARASDLTSSETGAHPALVLMPGAEGLTLRRVLLGGQQAFDVIPTSEMN